MWQTRDLKPARVWPSVKLAEKRCPISSFASATNLADKTISFDELAPGPYGHVAEDDSNSGIVVGDHSVLIVDAQAPR